MKLFLSAAWVTLELSILGFALAVPLGLGLALLRLYGRAPLRWLAAGYPAASRFSALRTTCGSVVFHIGGRLARRNEP